MKQLLIWAFVGLAFIVSIYISHWLAPIISDKFDLELIHPDSDWCRTPEQLECYNQRWVCDARTGVKCQPYWGGDHEF